MIAPSFENIVILIFGSPTTASSRADQNDPLRSQVVVGNPAIAIEKLTIRLALNCHLTSLDQLDGLLFAQRDLIEITIVPNVKVAPIPNSLLSSFNFSVRLRESDPIIERWMGCG